MIKNINKISIIGGSLFFVSSSKRYIRKIHKKSWKRKIRNSRMQRKNVFEVFALDMELEKEQKSYNLKKYK